jgi:DNA-binding IclR family transcriptional regulator
VFTQQPGGSGTYPVGITLVLSATVSGSAPLSYQWERNEIPLVNGGSIGGANTPILTIGPATQTETGTYRLGLELFELGMLVRRKMSFVNEARPYLRALMERTGESVHLTVLDHGSVLYVNNLASPQAIRMQSNLGARVPAHCCSEGKVLLAHAAPEILEQVIAAGLAPRTPKTIVRPQRLRDELARVRTRGFALDDEELEIGLRAAAAPIRDHHGDVIAAVSIAGPVQRVNKKTLQRFAVDAAAAARAVSQRLGYHPLRASAG